MRRRIRRWRHRHSYQHQTICWGNAMWRYYHRGLNIPKEEAWEGCPAMGGDPNVREEGGS